MKGKKIRGILFCVFFVTCVLTGCKEESDTPGQEVEVKDLGIVLGNEQSQDGMIEPAVQEPSEKPLEESAEEPTKKNILLVIDPGHQGEWVDMSVLEPDAPGSSNMKAKATSGTSGRYTGIPEYQLNLEISLALRDALVEQGYDVILTREDNETAISNSERAMLANNLGANALIRIHANGSEDSSANGALVLVGSESNSYVGHLYQESRQLGESILNAYCNNTGMQNRGIVLNDHMSGINWSQVPVIILEMGFMTNEQDDFNMANPEYRQKMVEGIVEGINAYYTPNIQDLEKRIREEIGFLQESGAAVSVYVEDLKSGVSVSVDNAFMRSASLIKLYIAGCVYERMAELQTQEQYSGETENLICRMIQSSDNDATNMLITRLGNGDAETGMELVNQFCQNHGYMETSLGRKMLDFNSTRENYTSVRDCGKILRDIYDSRLTSAEQILSYMKNQERRGKIPAGIPDGITTANKTGELTNVENDVAIVYAENGAYSICVMTDDLIDAGMARATIVNVSGIVYQYMVKNGDLTK